MYCEKCGKQLPDGTAFCDACGAAQPTAGAAPQAAPQQAAPAQDIPVAPVAPAPKKKFDFSKMTKKQMMIGGGIIGGAILLIVLLIIILCQPKGIKLDKYMSATTSGFNGYATVSYELDYETLCKDVLGEKAVQEVLDAEYSDWQALLDSSSKITKTYASMLTIRGAVTVDVAYPEGKHNGNLSNGDVVIYTVSFNETIAKKFDIKAKAREYKYTIEGLGDASVYNLLDNFSISVTGVDGYGRATIASTAISTDVGLVNFKVSENEYYIYYTEYSDSNDYEDSGSFYVYIEEDTYDLSNGDVLTLTVDVDSDRLKEYGVILEGLTKEVTVEGLTEAQEFDVLANFTAQFTGVDGDGDAEVVPVEAKEIEVGNMIFTIKEGESKVYYDYVDDSGWDSYFNIYIDNSYNLSNGDTVKLYCSYNDDYFLSDGGVTLTNLSKEETVEGLGEYMTSTEGVNFDALAEVYDEKVYNELYEDWGWMVHGSYYSSYEDQEIGDDFGLYKIILTTPKNTNSYTKNTLWLVYSVTLDDSELEKATKYYFFVEIDDVVVKADGTVDAERDYSYYDDFKRGYTSYNEYYDDYIKSFNLNIEEAELAA